MSSEADANHTIYPRLLKAHLRAQKGKPATIVGRVAKVMEGEKTLLLEVDPQSKAEIRVRVKNIDMNEFNGLTFIEVYGIVTPTGDDMLEMEGYTDFRDNFDLKVYNEIVKVSNEHFRRLFRAD